jgi:hypothetical protein
VTPEQVNALAIALLRLEVSARELDGKLTSLYGEVEMLEALMEQFKRAEFGFQSESLHKLRGLAVDPNFEDNLEDCKQAVDVLRPFVESLRRAVHAVQTDPEIGVDKAQFPELG